MPEALLTTAPFHEAHARPLRDLGLRIEGTRLEPVLAAFDRELAAVGLAGLRPQFYLADEWGVPFPSTAVGIPFYLARPDLMSYHAARTGLVEGATPAELLRYLRHEMGHVVSYAYRLYEREEWVARFGPFSRPYPEEYRPRPFSRDYVRHLPGWYAQKHPDEDWAETFAVWMTPGRDWRRDYADWPAALAKLEYCDRVVREVAGTPPLLAADAAAADDEEGDDFFAATLADIYEDEGPGAEALPGLDGALRAAFEDLVPDADGADASGRLPVGGLVRRLEGELVTNVFRWTGHFPERALALVRTIARRADELGQVYRPDREAAAVVALTALVTGLAINHVYTGEYFPAGGSS
jgi:hypothetical protein